MGFLRKKDRPYEVPDEVAGARSEIDDFRAKMRQQAGGSEENPELAKLKEQYDERFTDHLGGARRGDDGDDDEDDATDPREKEFQDLLGKSDPDQFKSPTSFASPDDSMPSADVPGLESRAKPPSRAKKSGGGGDDAQPQFKCDDCDTTFKERWTTCPKCGGKVNKADIDPEVEQLQAGAEAGMGGVRSVDSSSDLSSLLPDPVSEFSREESGGVKSADDLLTDMSDLDKPATPDSSAPAQGDTFACVSCGTEYKEKWGKCPKCGGEVERPRAPKEVDKIEKQHEAIDSMETPSEPAGTGGGSGSSMLDDLLGGGPSAPPPEEPKSKGFTDLPDLGGPSEPAEPKPPQAEPPSTPPPDDDFAPKSQEFRASDGLPDDPAGQEGMDDLLGGMDLPDEEDELVEDEAPTPSEGKEDEPTMDSVGIRQAEMSTDFSTGRSKASVTKKLKRKPSDKRRAKRKAKGKPPAKGPKQPSPFSRPAREAKYKPPEASPAMADIPPPPEELRSDLLDMLKEPSLKERRR